MLPGGRLPRTLDRRPRRSGRYDGSMALRVGIDLASIDAVEESVRVHSARYLGRVYTSRELRDCRAPDGVPDPRGLAARFAAKEAALKVLRVDDEAVPWRSIGVCTDRFGRPSLELTGAAAELARRRGVAQLDVSLTHEGPFAAAIVIAQVREER
jgi:holo-[acyl-carrier protein] synthase